MTEASSGLGLALYLRSAGMRIGHSVALVALMLSATGGAVSAQTAPAPQQNDNAAKFVDQTLVSGVDALSNGRAIRSSETKICVSHLVSSGDYARHFYVYWSQVNSIKADSNAVLYINGKTDTHYTTGGSIDNLSQLELPVHNLETQTRLLKAMEDLRRSCAPPSYGY